MYKWSSAGADQGPAESACFLQRLRQLSTARAAAHLWGVALRERGRKNLGLLTLLGWVLMGQAGPQPFLKSPLPALAFQNGCCPSLQLLEVNTEIKQSCHHFQLPIEQLQAACPCLKVGEESCHVEMAKLVGPPGPMGPALVLVGLGLAALLQVSEVGRQIVSIRPRSGLSRQASCAALGPCGLSCSETWSTLS